MMAFMNGVPAPALVIGLALVVVAAACSDDAVGNLDPDAGGSMDASAGGDGGDGSDGEDGGISIDDGAVGGADGAIAPDAGPIVIDGGTGPLPLDDFAVSVAVAWCQFLRRCDATPDLVTCLDATSPEWYWPELLQTVASARAGRIAYDGTRARECLAAMAGLECRYEHLRVGAIATAICPDVFTGTAAVDAQCYADEQCASQNCLGIPNPACTTFGRCRPTRARARGDSCVEGDLCQAGTFCDSGALAPNTCTDRWPLGEPCIADHWEYGCVAGAVCSESFAGDGNCIAMAGDGAACDPTSPRACLHFNRWCNPVTERCERRLADGAACTTPEQCVGWCWMGHCHPGAVFGEACSLFAGPWCMGTLVCDAGDTETCVRPDSPTICPG